MVGSTPGSGTANKTTSVVLVVGGEVVVGDGGVVVLGGDVAGGDVAGGEVVAGADDAGAVGGGDAKAVAPRGGLVPAGPVLPLPAVGGGGPVAGDASGGAVASSTALTAPPFGGSRRGADVPVSDEAVAAAMGRSLRATSPSTVVGVGSALVGVGSGCAAGSDAAGCSTDSLLARASPISVSLGGVGGPTVGSPIASESPPPTSAVAIQPTSSTAQAT